MQQLARTVVYWPNMDSDISKLGQQCGTCGQHQLATTQAPVHPWMMPEKPWSRIHVDHAIDFLGQHWLVMIDAYSKYPCIYPTTSVSTQTTINLLEDSFTHFGYPHTIVSDKATTFTSEVFQQYCKERGIVHLTGAPYHPATNGAAKRLIRTFKEALRKSSKPPKRALQEFLPMYRRTPSHCGYSPSELLNGRQICTKIDTLIPVPLQLPLPKKSIKKFVLSKLGIRFMLYTTVQEETAIQARFPELSYKPEAPAFFTYALFQTDQYRNATLTRFIGVMLHLRMTSRAIFLHVNCRFLIMCRSLNLTFPHLIACRNMDVITQKDLNETEDLHFATDNLDSNVFPHYLFYRGGVVLFYVCNYFFMLETLLCTLHALPS